LIISRCKQRNIDEVLKRDPVDFLFLTKNKNPSTNADIDNLIQKIEQFCLGHDNAVILLMRLDYLLHNVSFNHLLTWLYDLNDIVYESSSVFFVLCNDKSMLSKDKFMLLQNELNIISLNKKKSVLADIQILEVLKYVCEMNQQSVYISLKDIRRRFDVSYPTVRKRLDLLKQQGFVSIVKRGNRKVVYVTEAGLEILDKQ